MSDYQFNILRIDLTEKTTSIQVVSNEVLSQYLGGSSLGARLLFPLLTHDLDPLSPDAPLLFITGPLTGTLGPAVGRLVICAKSPATGLWGESNVGGHFGAELRAAGYDGLLIVGKAARPTYLSIDDKHVEFKDASHIWGNEDTYTTQDVIKNELGKPTTRVACIGLAGENRLPFALILCDHGRVAGRTGMGAVMGSKNLKAVAVHGNEPLKSVDEDALSTVRRRGNIELRKDNSSRVLRQLGTAGASDFFDYVGAMPKRYFTKGTFKDVEKLSGAEMGETILTGVSTCNGCVVACGRIVTIDESGPRKGPEYETIIGFGPNLEVGNLNKITKWGELCDKYGMDTISLSNVIGLLILLNDRKILTEKDRDGLDLEWGNQEAIEEIIHRTARLEGIGKIAALGARAIADRYDEPELAAQVNGLELAYHDPRGLSGMAIVYATSPRGGCHNQSDYYMVDAWAWTEEELGIHRFGRQSGPEKSKNIALHQDWRTVSNSLVVCTLPSPPVDTLLECLEAVTGIRMSNASLMMAGERGWNLKRLLNLKLGLSRADEKIPELLMEPLTEGGAANYTPPFEEMLEAYYHARSWDYETGFPSEDKIAELGLHGFDFRYE
jgi:aldehyde:ferredoxin oxidoreductase